MSVVRYRQWSVHAHPRSLAVGLLLVLLALGSSVLLVGSGEYPMSPARVVETLTGQGHPADVFIVQEVRLPRVVTGLLVGAALGLSGAVFQALVRNPLGSPDILGFTHGASAGAISVIVLFGGSSAALAGGAVVGAALTGVLVYLLAWRGGLHGNRLVLVGVGVAAILTGVNGYLLTRADINEAGRAVLWLTGSLEGSGWGNAVPLLLALCLLLPVVLLGCARGLRALEMGDDAAYSLGVPVERVRLVLLVCAVLLTAFAAAAAGPIAFVALTAPQLARRLTRAPGPNLVPALCMGAALVVCADLLAGRAFGDQPLPAGVVTGVLGGAYLVWLLATQRRAGRI
ncbi:iron chelate uptake ABC transporter family permease subunit [Streptomyces sp. P38-E01]|uniref:Iron chelate uptake ABC transporter family permease subunit n=1 Tax=Streptomyces tardus TaxID=2780544 RepID=A0A949N9N1_9ACTN|nr:iron chelate uptake ABC transporter family permease subunit [Streptomyces tardus]MBU7599766.1 iron chelate uptake ABC transporter family permease subunit [Streptomyces tardus]